MKSANWIKTLSIVAVFINALALAAHYYIARQFTAESALTPGVTTGPVAGVNTQGHYIDRASTNSFRCHVVRYTSVNCPWCRKDEPAWKSFDQALRGQGCDSIIFGPSATELPRSVSPASGQDYLPVVSASAARNFELYATPTTLVLDHDWKVLWSNLGILEKGDTEKALSLVSANTR
jgi:hypothetical protein